MKYKEERNNQIFLLRDELKYSYKLIAKIFFISPSRVRDIYYRQKEIKLIENNKSNHFKYAISKRLYNVITNNLGSKYLNDPLLIISYGLENMFKFRTFGKTLYLELLENLNTFGFIKKL